MLIVSGFLNKVFAEHKRLESYVVEAYPYLWMFDENSFLKRTNIIPEDIITILPEHVRSLLEKSDAVIWLSQFEDFEKFSPELGRAIDSFLGFYLRSC